MRILDAAWLPRVPMKRIICHWTAGGHRANSTDLRSYHILIEGDGKPLKGNASIALNSGSIKNGYAAHTLNCNTDSIGVSMCGMMGAVEHPFNPGPQPLTRPQWDAFIKAVADLCEAYQIPVTPRTVLFHAEVQQTLGITQRFKWDVSRLVFDSAAGARPIGDKMRAEVTKAMAGKTPEPKPDPIPAGGIEGGQGKVTSPFLNFRRGPGTNHESTGSLPEGVIVDIIGQEGVWLNVKSPAGFIGWVHGGHVQLLDTSPPAEPTRPDPIHIHLASARELLDALEADLPSKRDELAEVLPTILAHLRNV